jgi:hypothetical protein
MANKCKTMSCNIGIFHTWIWYFLMYNHLKSYILYLACELGKYLLSPDYHITRFSKIKLQYKLNNILLVLF